MVPLQLALQAGRCQAIAGDTQPVAIPFIYSFKAVPSQFRFLLQGAGARRGGSWGCGGRRRGSRSTGPPTWWTSWCTAASAASNRWAARNGMAIHTRTRQRGRFGGCWALTFALTAAAPCRGGW